MGAPAWGRRCLNHPHVLGLFRFHLYNVYLMKPGLQLSLFLYECVKYFEDEGILETLFCLFSPDFPHFQANVGLIHPRHRRLCLLICCCTR